MSVRIASFNVENLFTRAKVLNLRDNEGIDDKLTKIGQFQKLLEKATYSPADKAKMLELYGELKAYIEIQSDRGKFFNASNTKIVASGANSWDGTMAFRRARFSEMARVATGKVIKAMKADIQCVVEAENRPALELFDTDVLNGTYKFAMLVDGNDNRGIDVGVYSKFPLGPIETHIYDRDDTGRVFSRDCLEQEIRLPSGKSLWLLANHLKSKGYGPQAANDAKRKRQAARLRDILSDYDLANDYVVVAGDLNDTPDSEPLKPLTTLPGLHDVLELKFGTDTDKRWTYVYSGTKNQIDYLLVSTALKDKFLTAGLERRGIFKVAEYTAGAVAPFPEVTSATSAASDHAGVWADFDI